MHAVNIQKVDVKTYSYFHIAIESLQFAYTVEEFIMMLVNDDE